MTVSAYELRHLPKLIQSVASGVSPQSVLDHKVTVLLLSNLSEYDTFLKAHGYTWLSGADPLKDVMGDLELDDTLMTPEWKPTTISSALETICKATWPQFYTGAALDIDALRATAESL